MSFRINTNINSLNAQVQSGTTSKALATSLEKLSSGLRINKAADDASGMAIADSLRAQSNSLGQAIKNANDGVGIIQIADKAMDEQIKILDTIKTKATQAAQDGQTTDTRKALQADISKLLQALDGIATSTSFNGQSLLNGSYTNKQFQVGAYSNQTINVSVGATHSSKIGDVRFETSTVITAAVAAAALTFSAVDGQNDVTLESVAINTSVGTGLGALTDIINKNSDRIGGVKASWTNVMTGTAGVAAGDATGVTLNGIDIGNISAIQANDGDGKLVNAINVVKDQTGVEAYTDERGRLNLRSLDGRGIKISGTGVNTIGGLANASEESYGRLTLTKAGAKDIAVTTTALLGGFSTANGTGLSETVVNLGDMKGAVAVSVANAMGAFTHSANAQNVGALGAGVTTMTGAMGLMSIADSAIKQLDSIRSDLGSTQNQFNTTINNISVTRVNVAAAESQIRDVDFAEESASFQKFNILAQAGSYALSQANQLQQNVQRLLQ